MNISLFFNQFMEIMPLRYKVGECLLVVKKNEKIVEEIGKLTLKRIEEITLVYKSGEE